MTSHIFDTSPVHTPPLQHPQPQSDLERARAMRAARARTNAMAANKEPPVQDPWFLKPSPLLTVINKLFDSKNPDLTDAGELTEEAKSKIRQRAFVFGGEGESGPKPPPPQDLEDDDWFWEKSDVVPMPHFPAPAHLTPWDLDTIGGHVVGALQVQDRKASEEHLSKLQTQFGRVFANQTEMLGHLREAREFFSAYRKREMELVRQEQWKTIFTSLSQMGKNLGIPEMWTVGKIGNMGVEASRAISSLQSAASPLDCVAPCFSLASIAISAFTLFNDDGNDGDQFNQMLAEYLGAISQQVATVRTEMHGRFDRVEKQLETIHRTLERSTDILKQSIHDAAVPTLATVQQTRTAIEELSYACNFKFDELLFREFEKAVVKIDNYTNDIIPRSSLKREKYFSTLASLENAILNHSSSQTFNGAVYKDITPQGINRTLSVKEVPHLIGFLGLYIRSALGVNHPSIDPSQICNPHMWSAGISRYLAFKKAFPQFPYDQNQMKLRMLLHSGQAILDYSEFLSNQTGIFTTLLERYSASLVKLQQCINLYGNQKFQDLFKQIGFTTAQIEFMQIDIMFNTKARPQFEYSQDTDFLLSRTAASAMVKGPLGLLNGLSRRWRQKFPPNICSLTCLKLESSSSPTQFPLLLDQVIWAMSCGMPRSRSNASFDYKLMAVRKHYLCTP